jgi:hypothetical protein
MEKEFVVALELWIFTSNIKKEVHDAFLFLFLFLEKNMKKRRLIKCHL